MKERKDNSNLKKEIYDPEIFPKEIDLPSQEQI